MNLPSRSLGLALLLLLLFLGASVGLQWWLQRETLHLQKAATTDLGQRLDQTLAASGRTPEQWDEPFRRQIETLLGDTVEFFPTDHPPASPVRAGVLTFTRALSSAPGWSARVTLGSPALLRVQVLHQRMLAAIVLLALLLALVPLLAVVLGSRATDGGTRVPWAATQAQATGFAHFAKISVERSAALAEEHGARLRAEENLLVNRSLLDNSVGERIRLGRELHDNICQTLYAVCLTLESVQKKHALAPELGQRVDQCMTELRRLNQEVRAYLRELEPGRVHGDNFAAAVTAMLGTFNPGNEVKIEQRLDPDTVAAIPPDRTAEVINILREAVSNSLRHGRPRTITLLAGRSDLEIALAVQDDGNGFNSDRPGTGHGLGNMRARAAALGGDLRIESGPGKGTRILLVLPVALPT